MCLAKDIIEGFQDHCEDSAAIVYVGQVIIEDYYVKDSTDYIIYVTGSGKTGLIVTITDIHFLPISLCHKLKAHYCSLSLSGCFNPPSALSHPPPPPPTPLPPAHPL